MTREPKADPTARALRSMIVSGTWPGYAGGGRERTEKVRWRRDGGRARRWRRVVAAVIVGVIIDSGV